MKTYKTPTIEIVKLETAGTLLNSSSIPVNPNEEGTPTTKAMDGGWNSSSWE